RMRVQATLQQTRLLFSLTACLAGIATNAQTGAQPPLLTFNVVAVDAKGAPLRDLRASDLHISDDGKPMQIAFCRPVETTERKSAALGPREFSNRPTGGKLQSTLVLLDLLNANLSERGLGSEEIVQALQKSESGERIYVYLLTKDGALYTIHPLPGGDNVSPEDGAWLTRVQPLLDKALHDVNRLRPWEFQVNPDARVQRTLDLLWELVSDYGTEPGRKSLVWISHGVPIIATAHDSNV